MAYNVIKISRISPATDLVDSLVLPLSFFDLVAKRHSHEPSQLLQTHRVISRLLLLTHPPQARAYSLSLVLSHFLPLSGHVKWNPGDPKPHIIVSPQDAVSLTVAETDADFSHLSGKGLRYQTELHPLVPELPVSSDSAPILTLQITLFPSQGFCIGTTIHHAAVDGKTLVKFLKSWAHICKYGTIPQDLDSPMLLDRTVINLPSELPNLSTDVRTLKLPPVKEIEEDVVRFTFELTLENVKKLMERAKSESTRSDLQLSTFVVTYAYVLTCVVKARGVNSDQPVPFTFVADFRDRLDPPVPASYFGNCVLPVNFLGYKAKTFFVRRGVR